MLLSDVFREVALLCLLRFTSGTCFMFNRPFLITVFGKCLVQFSYVTFDLVSNTNLCRIHDSTKCKAHRHLSSDERDGNVVLTQQSISVFLHGTVLMLPTLLLRFEDVERMRHCNVANKANQ